jgi:hypothetical protein
VSRSSAGRQARTTGALARIVVQKACSGCQQSHTQKQLCSSILTLTPQ